MDNKYRYGKYGLLWQDIYELFQKIADRCFDEGPDMINKMAEEFFEEHKSDPLFQEAFHKWCDVEEDYEEIAESRCINCSQSGKLYKNRLKDVVREGQLEGADADEFMLDLIDSISDQKAKELCIDYGILMPEADVESSIRGVNSSATRLGRMAADISDRIQTFIEQVRPVASGYLTREDLNTLFDATDVLDYYAHDTAVEYDEDLDDASYD